MKKKDWLTSGVNTYVGDLFSAGVDSLKRLPDQARALASELPRAAGRFALQGLNLLETVTVSVATAQACENIGVPENVAMDISAVVFIGMLATGAYAINEFMDRPRASQDTPT